MALEWIGWVVGGTVVVGAFVAIGYYNRFKVLGNQIDNAWSQIDVQLKKRADLVPNLVETVKGYAKHERKVFTEVTKARTAMMGAKSVAGKMKADNMLTDALKSVFAVAEAYPKLEASKNFQALQEELSSIENKVAYARQFYNDSVLTFNNLREVFPSNIIAGMMGYNKDKQYFEATAAERKSVKVKFE
ncbi:MAG: LemA family protein [Candidatus Diapherotrites archaeon]|nr:LemA family protein [Candidatus Diapherotrites archaeon]